MAENGTLSTKQRRALEALLTQSTTRAAAKTADVGERTIHRWLAEPTFKAALRRLQDGTIKAATARLAGLHGDALGVLKGVLDDKKATVGVRVRAALGILEHGRRAIELVDLADRVAALEGAEK